MTKLHKNIVLLSLFVSSAHAADQSNYPPHEAAKNGKIDMVQMLLNAGSDISLLNKEGNTALMYAAKNGDIRIIQFLLHHGADVNQLNNQGKTALSYLNRNFDQAATLTHLVKNTQTPSLHIHHHLLKEDYLQSLFKEICEGSPNQDLRQYIDILLVNKMLNYIKEDQRPTFYQACCDAYKHDDDLSIIIEYHHEYKADLVSGYIRNMHPDFSLILEYISPIISAYRWAPEQDTYAGFLQIARGSKPALFEVTKQAENHEAVATQDLASALAKHGIVQDAEKVSNKPLDVIIPLLFACMRNKK